MNWRKAWKQRRAPCRNVRLRRKRGRASKSNFARRSPQNYHAFDLVELVAQRLGGGGGVFAGVHWLRLVAASSRTRTGGDGINANDSGRGQSGDGAAGN